MSHTLLDTKLFRVIACVLAASAFGSTAGAETVLKLAHGAARESPAYGLTQWAVGIDAFKEYVTSCTKGEYTFEEFPFAQLGGERELLESSQIGAIDISVHTSGALPNFVPEIGILDLPYLFRDGDHAAAVLDGPIGDELLQKLTDAGLVGLGWGGQGFRHISNDVREVHTLEDLNGLKIRTQENPMHIAAFQALGMLPTPLAWPIYTPLQQGVVDGQENPLSVILSARLHEVQRYVTKTGHVYSAIVFIASPVTWATLPEEVHHCFTEGAKIGGAKARERTVELEELSEKIFEKDFGINVVDDFDQKAAAKALQKVYDEVYTPKYGAEAIDAIRKYGQ